jgi:hypothetical protein
MILMQQLEIRTINEVHGYTSLWELGTPVLTWTIYSTKVNGTYSHNVDADNAAV